MTRFGKADIAGAGIGLRSQHYQEIIKRQPGVKWFEALTENYFGEGGLPLHHLEQVRKNYPITLHGIGMSLGSTDTVNPDYLTRLKKLAQRFEPVYISDHLAWVSISGRYLHDLMPLPYTEESLFNFTANVIQAQDYLGRQLLIENPASYLSFNHSEMTEWEFINELVKKADCNLLIDVNNVYVSAVNHGFDAIRYIESMPAERVKEIHLAGYEEHNNYLFDTHGYPVHSPVWELYKMAIKHFGPVPTLIEWDTDIPEFNVLVKEADKADQILREAI